MKEKIEILKEKYKDNINKLEDILLRLEGKDPPRYMIMAGKQEQLQSVVTDLEELLN